MKVRIKILIVCFSLLSTISFSQQREQYTNYIMNNFVINPACGGSYPFWMLEMGYRTQWVGLGEGPKTFFTSFHGPLFYPDPRKVHRQKFPHQGVGGYFYYDKTAPISYTAMYGSYTYHQKLNRKWTASLGGFFGMKEFKLDGEKLHFVDVVVDPMLANGIYSSMMPDMNLGLFIYSDRGFFGMSGNQLLQSKIKFQDLINEAYLHSHYFMTAGWKFEMSKDLFFFPTVLVKAIRPAPLSVDMNLRFMYSDFFWTAVSYRAGDAISVCAEYIFKDTYEIGYAYDATLTKLRKVSSGSHEIMVGVRWANARKQMVCPSKYW